MGKLLRPVKHALTGLTAVLVAAGGLLLSTAAPAAAVPGPIEQRNARGVTADALPTAQINGVVWDQIVIGDIVYAGGSFTSARPAGSPAGSNETPRSNLLAYNIRTGVLVPGFAPTVNGQVKTLAVSPDKTRLYIGGTFTQVNGVNRYRIASFAVATGALTTFAPAPNTAVNGIAVTDTAVYAGGSFTKIGAADRLRLAAFHPTTGALLAWAPSADATVHAVLPTPDRSRVIVAGAFANLNGSTAQGLGSIDAGTATLLPWAANNVVRNYGTTAAMLKLRTDGETIYAVGYWYGGTGNFEGVLAADPNSGNVKWLADCHGDTYDVTPMNDAVYAVSHWHHCENAGGFPDTNPRNAWYHGNAMTKAATGTVKPNNQGGYYDFSAYPAPSLINWYPTLQTGTFTGQSQAAWSSTATSEYLVLGGEFPNVNGTAQQGLVRFAIPSLAPKKQGPRVAGAAFNPTLLAVRPTEVKIKWVANHDRDDNALTYAVTRVGTATPIYTTTATSQFWNRPALSTTDTGLTPGQTYKYRVSATDPDGNTVQSEIVSVTMPTTVDPYVTTVLDDNASNYWRLNSSGTNQVDYAGNLNQTSAGTTTTAGALTGDNALSFPGTASGQSGTTAAVTGPTTFTAEGWFKTTTNAGGKILGFGGSSTGNSGSYDRHIYMDNSGRITFGVYPNAVKTVRSTSSYNDGQWHHVAASLSAAGMQLSLDGLKVASDPSVTGAQEYAGFWRIGGDNLGSWPDQPSSQYFNGSIDDVAIYPTALSGAQIRDHYTKSGRTLAIPAAPTDAYGQAVYNDDPALYWRLNEASGATATDVSANMSNGTYYGGVSYRTVSPVADPAYAATFNGNDGLVSSNARFNNPKNYTEEIWFKTTTTSGGKLIGFGANQTGTSGGYDRHVYMSNDGKLTFGVWTGFTNTITTDTALNDGVWHQVVATQSTSVGMALYVDGKLVGTNGQTDAQDYAGYWRIGGDNHWGCCSPFFAGDLDEAAVYAKVLTAAQVKAHYEASPAATNDAPVAAFTSTCADGACTFDSTTSADPDGSIVGRAWNFGDQTTSTNATPTHGYTASGTYNVSLTVTDNKGATNTTTQPVTVTVIPPNVNPVADFTFNCIDRSCMFDSSGSVDPDGSTIASYAWTFGNGAISTDANPAQVYAANGTYSVKLVVTDDRGGTHSVTKSVAVHKNVEPTVALSYDCDELVCDFDSSGTTDPDGTVAAYAWNFGDGATSSQASPAHTYQLSGTYPVSLTVTDNDGGTTTRTDSVTVSVTPNALPTAAFSMDCNQLACTFNGSASNDTDGTIASYSWDFGDGTVASGQTATRTYAMAGTYTVTLTVTDNEGGVGTETATFSVAPTPNTPPVAAYTFNCVQRDCTFNGTGSNDPDGTIVSYLWNFGDAATADTDSPSHSYTANGSYPVKLTVTDNRGDSASITKTVTVSVAVNAAPTAAFTNSCTNLVCSFNGGGSSDTDGTISGYAWNFGDSTPNGTGATPNHTFAAAGTYSVKLTVTDDDGATGAITKSVTVTSAPAGPIAADTFGRTVTRWGNADTGGAYTYSGTTFATTGSKGTIKLASPGVSATAYLNSVSARDVNVVTDFAVDKTATGSGTYNSLVVRRVGTSDYRLAFQELTAGKTKLTISKTVGGTSTVLRQVALSDVTYNAGDTIRVRFTASGNGTTNLSAKAWKASGTEPATAEATVTDNTASLQTAGSFAIVSYLASNATNAPVTVSVDNLLITAP